MKKVILTILLILLLVGCEGNMREQGDKINIVCTIFPHYDWVRQIIGEDNMDKYNLTLLIDNRIDLHSYSPSVHDITKIKNSDVFIYIGGDSDSWVSSVLNDTDVIAINLFELLGDMVIWDDHNHDEEDCDEDHENEEPHADEHVWLSLKNAKFLCTEIANMLIEADPENAKAYIDNLNAYTTQLSALDNEFKAVTDTARVTSLVFADRFPFRYLTEDYGLKYYAAFSGCSAETEASFVTIISLANRVNQLGVDVVMVTESADQSIAQTVINSTDTKNQRILVLDAMQSVTSADVESGVTYLSVMRNNLEVLKDALN